MPQVGVFGQETASDKNDVSYEMVLTEFRFDTDPDAEISSDEILRQFQDRNSDDDIVLVETVRLRTQADIECQIQYGKQLEVTTGIIQNGRGQQRVTQTIAIGTILRVILSPEDGKVLVRMTYESSKLEGEGDVDSPPDTTKSTLQTTVLAEPGELMLLGGQASGKGRFFVAVVR